MTVAAIPVAREYASDFGVIEATEDGRITGFHEKTPQAPTMPGDSDRVYASMGNYIFSTRALLDLLNTDAKTLAVITISARTSCQSLQVRPPSMLTTSRRTGSRRARRLHPATGAMSAPSMPTMKPTWT